MKLQDLAAVPLLGALTLMTAACERHQSAPPASQPTAQQSGQWIRPPAPPPAAPAKMVTMVCRNSQTGAPAECGTPNAVMVGVKEK